MTHVPALRKVAILPLMVHTDALSELNVTGLPDKPPIAVTV